MRPRSAWWPAAGAMAVLAALRYLEPPSLEPYSLCGFHWLTGRPCPLCGTTRALFALAKGNWGQALHFNALSPLALAMILTLFWPSSWRARLWPAGLVAFAVYGLGRVFFPFV